MDQRSLSSALLSGLSIKVSSSSEDAVVVDSSPEPPPFRKYVFSFSKLLLSRKKGKIANHRVVQQNLRLVLAAVTAPGTGAARGLESQRGGNGHHPEHG